MGQENKRIRCAQFLDIFAMVVAGGYLKVMLSGPSATRMFTIGRGARIRGKYFKMVNSTSGS